MLIHQKTFKNLTNAKIYLVGTPIGNLDDFSTRAKKVLQEVDLIFCEDTRTSQVLLNHYQIKNKLASLHKFNETERFSFLAPYLHQGQKVAIISDAGVPVISDPGAKIINKIRDEFPNLVDITAVNVGPAYIHALITTGFLSPQHYFYGFLTNKTPLGKKQELVNVISKYHHHVPIIFYESVHRIQATIRVLQEILPPKTTISVARELTKINEEILQGSLQEVSAFVLSDRFVSKGEFVIVLEKATKNDHDQQAWTQNEILDQVNGYLNQGFKLREACQIVGDLANKTKNEIYQLYVKNQK